MEVSQSHSFVAIGSLRTEIILRSFWKDLNALFATVASLLSPMHAITNIIRVVSVVKDAHHEVAQAEDRLPPPPPALEPPVIALPPC